MKKPPYVSHYLVLSDLIEGIDVRAKSDIIFYLCSRIENIKVDLKKEGLEFFEDITKESTYTDYKPYILIPKEQNIARAKKLLKRYGTVKVLNFLQNRQKVN